MLNRIRQFLVNEDGPTATEYAVMLALVIIVCIAGITLLGSTVNGVFNTVAGGLPSGAAP
jgi:pilus assembly protein Flp/PilA